MRLGDLLDVVAERPVAGGRMIARVDGAVVFVAGALPGERVRVRVTRTTKHATWAEVVDVVAASSARRDPIADPACGGLNPTQTAQFAAKSTNVPVSPSPFLLRSPEIADGPFMEPFPVAAGPRGCAARNPGRASRPGRRR